MKKIYLKPEIEHLYMQSEEMIATSPMGLFSDEEINPENVLSRDDDLDLMFGLLE